LHPGRITAPTSTRMAAVSSTSIVCISSSARVDTFEIEFFDPGIQAYAFTFG
jgi:hypothetical protein